MIKSIKKENERVKRKKERAMEKQEEIGRRKKKNPTYFTNHMNSEGGASYPQLF